MPNNQGLMMLGEKIILMKSDIKSDAYDMIVLTLDIQDKRNTIYR